MDIGEADVPARVEISQFLMIESQLVKNRGPEVVNRSGILNSVVAEVISRAINRAPLESSTCEPN
jgi:hypothetical protein